MHLSLATTTLTLLFFGIAHGANEDAIKVPEGFEFVLEVDNTNANNGTESSGMLRGHRNLLTKSWGVFRNGRTGNHLQVVGQTCKNGMRVESRPPVRYNNKREYVKGQQFRFISPNGNVATGLGFIENRKCNDDGKDLVLDVSAVSCRRGAAIQMWKRHGVSNQLFTYSDSRFRAMHCPSTEHMVLDDAWGESKVHLWNKSSASSQKWTWKSKTF